MPYEPPYINLHKKGGLKRRKEQLFGLLESCTLCPRKCRVNRLEGEEGYCGAGKDLVVSSVFPHFGEEPPLVGMNGSGTIFLTHCNLLCVFCQNYDISHQGQGQKISIRDLAEHMIYLQSRGCHNINFVTPTHYISQIIATLPEAIERGLKIPLVYNCGGYDSLEVLRLLDGIIDIYMPDAKYGDNDVSAKYSNAPDYFEILKESLKEMQRQTGDLIIDERGVAQRGLLVRHLIMPNGLAGTKRILEFIAKEISKNTYVNIMNQYRPCYKAGEYQELARRIAPDEFFEAVDIAKKAGLYRGF